MLARRLRLAGDFDFKLIAQRTPGFVGADLQALTKEAAAIAIKRIFAQLGAPPQSEPAAEDMMEAGAVSLWACSFETICASWSQRRCKGASCEHVHTSRSRTAVCCTRRTRVSSAKREVQHASRASL